MSKQEVKNLMPIKNDIYTELDFYVIIELERDHISTSAKGLRGENNYMELNQVSLDDFLAKLSDNTKQTYGRELRRFEEALVATGGSLDALTRADVQMYLGQLSDQHKAATTINKVFAAIRSWCHATNQSQAVNDLRIVKPPRLMDQPVKSLNRNERNQLLRSVERTAKNRDIAIVYMLLQTGLRVHELVGLNVEDLQLSDRGGTLRVVGKGSRERIVPLPADTRYWMHKNLEGRQSGPLFLSNRKQRIRINTVQKLLAKFGTHPHALRHTFCRSLVSSGIDLPAVATLAGHADINVTRRYARPSAEELTQLMDKAFRM